MPRITWKVKCLCLLAGLMMGAAAAARGDDAASTGVARISSGVVRISDVQPVSFTADAGLAADPAGAPWAHLGHDSGLEPVADQPACAATGYIHRPPIYHMEGTECCRTGNPILDWWRRHTTKHHVRNHQRRLQRDAAQLAEWEPFDRGCPPAHVHGHATPHHGWHADAYDGSHGGHEVVGTPVESAVADWHAAPAADVEHAAQAWQIVRPVAADGGHVGDENGQCISQGGGHHPGHACRQTALHSGHGDFCDCRPSGVRRWLRNPFKKTDEWDGCDHCKALHGKGFHGAGKPLGAKALGAGIAGGLRCKLGFLHPTGCCGYGCPLVGSYALTYPVNPDYFDPRDGRVYAAQGFGAPMAVPLAPNVAYTYNYGWGIPSSRVTPVSRHYPTFGAVFP